MNADKLRIAQAAARACTNQALAEQLRIYTQVGTSAEWRQAILEEAATRLEKE